MGLGAASAGLVALCAHDAKPADQEPGDWLPTLPRHRRENCRHVLGNVIAEDGVVIVVKLFNDGPEPAKLGRRA
ncbi:hypothetical protein [Phytohabitans flavus]|uniref:hypothetical protein n=1 Tax=Phytohabitans flavus TaxID=1076124 RepID=UPI001564B4DC|nr:hypothetical protein [Phytohabitans flavus]